MVNARDDMNEEVSGFAHFKEQYRAVQAYERDVFAAFRNSDSTCCSVDKQCTTAAVFHQMDQITFALVHQSIGRGLEAIGEKVQHLADRMQRELAPPLSFYDGVVCTDSDEGVCKKKRLEILDAVRNALRYLLIGRFRQEKIYDNNSKAAFLDSIGVRWLAEHSYEDMAVADRQNEAIESVRTFFTKYLLDVSQLIETVCLGSDGCMSRAHSPFHRIDRFNQLTEALSKVISTALPSCAHRADEAVGAYLKNFQCFEVPRGVRHDRILQLCDELKRVALE